MHNFFYNNKILINHYNEPSGHPEVVQVLQVFQVLQALHFFHVPHTWVFSHYTGTAPQDSSLLDSEVWPRTRRPLSPARSCRHRGAAPSHLQVQLPTLQVSVMPSEDLQLGACARLLDIPLLPSLDRHGRSRWARVSLPHQLHDDLPQVPALPAGAAPDPLPGLPVAAGARPGVSPGAVRVRAAGRTPLRPAGADVRARLPLQRPTRDQAVIRISSRTAVLRLDIFQMRHFFLIYSQWCFCDLFDEM